MDHIGNDVHKRESQIYVSPKGVRSSSSGFAPSQSASHPLSYSDFSRGWLPAPNESQSPMTG
jgi:hypothetical protein